MFWGFNLLCMHCEFTRTRMGNYNLSHLCWIKYSLSSVTKREHPIAYRKSYFCKKLRPLLEALCLSGRLNVASATTKVRSGGMPRAAFLWGQVVLHHSLLTQRNSFLSSVCFEEPGGTPLKWDLLHLSWLKLRKKIQAKSTVGGCALGWNHRREEETPSLLLTASVTLGKK